MNAIAREFLYAAAAWAAIIVVLSAASAGSQEPPAPVATNWVEIEVHANGTETYHIRGPQPKSVQEAIDILQRAGLPKQTRRLIITGPLEPGEVAP